MASSITEQTTAAYTCTLLDEAGAAVPLSDLNTLTLTLYEVSTDAFVNGRNAQDVLNANNVSYHATSGLLTWSVQVGDTSFVTAAASGFETHRAVFTATWSTTKQKTWFVDFQVANLFGVS